MYSHDITHCNNENCKNKDTCYRYLAHLEAKEKGYTYLNEISKKSHKSLAHG